MPTFRHILLWYLLVLFMNSCQHSADAWTDLGICPPNIPHICESRKVDCYESEYGASLVSIRCFTSRWEPNNPGEIGCLIVKKDICHQRLTCSDTNKHCEYNCSTHYRCPGDPQLCMERSRLCSRNPDSRCGEPLPSCVAGFKCIRKGKECVIPQVLVRDGIEDCDKGEDECNKYEKNICHTCRGGTRMTISSRNLCDGFIDCDDMSDECVCPGKSLDYCQHISRLPQISMEKKCLEEELQKDLCPELSEFAAQEFSSGDGDNFTKIEDLMFECKPTTNYNYSKVVGACRKCDFNIHCPAGDDEANCSDGRHYCPSGEPPFVRASQINDGRIDCIDASDECNEMHGSNSMLFNSRYALIGNNILFRMVWVMMVAALLGNVIVIVWEVRMLVKMRGKRSVRASLRANRLLVVNLSASNFLMGVYLMMLGINYELLRGCYCFKEVEWRASATCTSMGALVVISVESSVLTTLILASVRLYTVRKPYVSLSYPRTRWIILLILFTWIVPVVIALIPLTATYRNAVPDTIWVPGNPFVENAKANMTSAKDFLHRYSAFYAWSNETLRDSIQADVSSTNSWPGLVQISSRVVIRKEYFEIKAWLGYYNIHSVCIPDLFPLLHSPHWILSTVVTNFNILSFLVVAALYIAVYRYSHKSSDKAGKGVEDGKIDRMQWKIFRLTASSFCCWVPIYVLSYTRLAGSSLSGDVYVGTAIILLPLNSALSPFFYSTALPTIRKVLLGHVTRVAPGTLNRRRANGDLEQREN